jgi:hypothetical protein
MFVNSAQILLVGSHFHPALVRASLLGATNRNSVVHTIYTLNKSMLFNDYFDEPFEGSY